MYSGNTLFSVPVKNRVYCREYSLVFVVVDVPISSPNQTSSGVDSLPNSVRETRLRFTYPPLYSFP